MLKHMRESATEPLERIKIQKATWMADGTHWPGTWASPAPEHSKGDHAGILQVALLFLFILLINLEMDINMNSSLTADAGDA